MTPKYPVTTAAHVLAEDSRVIRLQDEAHNFYYYYVDSPGAIPVYGYPVVLLDAGNEYRAHVFVCLPSGPPILLKVEPVIPTIEHDPISTFRENLT